MKYDLVNRGNPGSKDVTAFYGLNRTGKINDFQLSDMENMDAGSFPFVETRRERSVFWGKSEEESTMQMICSDTDVYDDYKLTGVTDSGAFFYRGKKVFEGGYSGDVCMLEHMGDYVFLPSKKVVRVNADETATELDFEGKTDGFLGDEIRGPYSIYQYTSNVGGPFNISNHHIRGAHDPIAATGSYLKKYEDFFFSHAKPGQVFSLDLLCRYGKGLDDLRSEYRCEIPEDVYMVMNDVYYIACYKQSGDLKTKKISYGDVDFSASSAKAFYEALNGEYPCTLHIEFTARKKHTGEVYDISQHFQYYPAYSDTLTTGNYFLPGLAYVDLAGDYKTAWNDFHINLYSSDVMLFGASFGGRLFACDNLGITVHYSASGSYDFEVGASIGGAGFLSCAEPGKWVAMCVYNDALYVFKRNGMYRIYSGDGLSYYMDKIADVGAIERLGVCVVDNVLYFLSDDGIYQFTGSYPQLLPDSLGRRYTGGAMGGDDGRLYASLKYAENGEEKTELIVWHTDKRIFSRHDDFSAKQFLVALGGVYVLSENGKVFKVEGERCAVPFSLTTKKYFFGFSKKAANAARIFFEYEKENEDDSFLVEVSYDGGEFLPCGAPISNGRVRYLPVKFRKCDELMLRISGRGIFTLKGLSFSVYQGGDIKQNHKIKW